MAREIKFRGKTPQGEWLYGDLQQCNDGTVRIAVNNESWNDDGIQSSDYLKILEVNPDTIGQFTGLHDKNGKEIYEGDILRKSTFYDNDFTETYLDRDTVGVVKILPSCGTTICNCIVYETDNPYEEKKMKERIKRAQVVGKRSEVIGNIYDNPELLKQK